MNWSLPVDFVHLSFNFSTTVKTFSKSWRNHFFHQSLHSILWNATFHPIGHKVINCYKIQFEKKHIQTYINTIHNTTTNNAWLKHQMSKPFPKEAPSFTVPLGQVQIGLSLSYHLGTTLQSVRTPTGPQPAQGHWVQPE